MEKLNFCVIFAVAAFLAAAGPCLAVVNDAVATVDGVPAVTVADLIYFYRIKAGEMPSTGNDVEARARDILEKLITAEILEIEAAARGYDRDASLAANLDAFRSSALREKMWRRAEAGVTVTEDEVVDFYDKNTKWRMYSFFESDEPETAAEAYEELKAGVPWEEVVRKYSADEYIAETGGACEMPLPYTGDNASRAVYDTPAGSFTPVVEDESGLKWRIFRVDKVVHGQRGTLAEREEEIRTAVGKRKAGVAFEAGAAEWREATPVKRNLDVLSAVRGGPMVDVREEYYGRGLAISRCGDVPVLFDGWLDSTETLLGVGGEATDRYRRENPILFDGILSKTLEDLENWALAENEALRLGLDKDDDLTRELAKKRADYLISALYERDLRPRLPFPTEEDIARCYGAREEDFQKPEVAEAYVVLMPDEGKLRAYHAEVEAGKDLVVSGEIYKNEKRRAETLLEEQPPVLPPEKEEFLGVVKIAREPGALGDEAAARDAELAKELRPIVFQYKLEELSRVFQLRDGRWGFFKTIYYRPFEQLTLEDLHVARACRRRVEEEIINSPQVVEETRAWLEELKAGHAVSVDDEAFEAAVAYTRSR